MLMLTQQNWPRWAQAGRKALLARLRNVRVIPVRHDWRGRAEACERCPLRVVQCGVSYCGRPFRQQPDRDTATEGCGCPTREKARSPGEHCPLDACHRPATLNAKSCNCKWCTLPPARAA